MTEYSPQTFTISFEGHAYEPVGLIIALHAYTRPVGLGALNELGRELTRDEAEMVWRTVCNTQRSLEQNGFHLDYIAGRPIKVTVRDGEIAEHSELLYDRDAGKGMFRLALQRARRDIFHLATQAQIKAASESRPVEVAGG